jgi:hypothetical protein
VISGVHGPGNGQPAAKNMHPIGHPNAVFRDTELGYEGSSSASSLFADERKSGPFIRQRAQDVVPSGLVRWHQIHNQLGPELLAARLILEMAAGFSRDLESVSIAAVRTHASWSSRNQFRKSVILKTAVDPVVISAGSRQPAFSRLV